MTTGTSEELEELDFERTVSNASTGFVKSVTGMKGLSLDIEPDLLRGVRVERVMAEAGRIFSGRCAGAAAIGIYFQRSEFVDKLDDFISHDWLTPRPLKYLTLCFVYNAAPAAICSIVAGVLCCVCQAQELLPLLGAERTFRVGGEYVGSGQTGGWCTLVAGPSVFWIVFFFGQRLRVLVGLHPVMVFLDKICINQIEEDLKLRAVRSLAGFLNKSRRLVILWSPRYFTRLWCTYEIATWIHLNKTANNSVLFMPVILTPVYLLIVMVMWAVVVFFTVMGDDLTMIATIIALLIMLMGLAVAAHLLRHLLRDLGDLVRQLENFNIRNSECYCCTNNHTDPVSGGRLVCDRKAVYNTVTAWFGGNEDSFDNENNALDEFDRRVRSDFANNATISAGRTGPRLNDYSNALVASSPLFWYGLDRSFPSGHMGNATIYFRTGVQWLVIYLTAVPIVISLTLRLASCLQDQAGTIQCGCISNLRWACTPVASVMATSMLVGLFYAQWSPGENLPLPHQMVIALIQVASAAWLYRRSVSATLQKHMRRASAFAADEDDPGPSVSRRNLAHIVRKRIELEEAKDVLPDRIRPPGDVRKERRDADHTAPMSPGEFSGESDDDHIQIMESETSEPIAKKPKAGFTLHEL